MTRYRGGVAYQARAKLLKGLWRMGIYTPPDRRVLERLILPLYARDPAVARVLAVGVSWYTRRYAGIFAGRDFVTIDAQRAQERFAGPQHVTDRIERGREHFAPRSFDLILLNGVIGFGLDDLAATDAALDECWHLLRPGGRLLVGVNELHPQHVALERTRLAQLFAEARLGTMGPCLTVPNPFEERFHTFRFFERRASRDR